MPRIDIELTSTQPEGTWTWRAAGARQPKGVLEGSLLDSGAQVGDVVRAECEIDLDGTRVVSVLPSRTKRREPDRLDIKGSGQDAPLVTQDGGAPDLRGERPRREGRGGGGRDRDAGSRYDGGPGGRGPAGRGTDRKGFPAGGRPGGPPSGSPGGTRSPGDRATGDRARSDRPQGDRPPRPDGAGTNRRDRPSRSASRPEDARRAERPSREQSGRPRRGRPDTADSPASPRPPRPKRLQPARVHREAVLAELPPEQRPVAEKVLRGGIPSVRQAVEDQNAEARASGAPEIKADALVAMAESLLPRLRAAEWRDRADAAAAAVDEIALRDLRAIVAGSDAAGRDDESRALAASLREALERRTAVERDAWVSEIRASLVDGRVVRALRVSGRLPDPGARFPADLGEELSTAAGAAMTADTVADRWAALLDAVVSSPVRRTVQPQGVPADRGEDFERALRLAAPRIPALAAMLGPPRPPRPARPGASPPGRSGPRGPHSRPGSSGAEPGPEPGAVAAPVAVPAAPDVPPVAEVEAPAPPTPEATPGPVDPPPEAVRSGDDGDDAVLVEELS